MWSKSIEEFNVYEAVAITSNKQLVAELFKSSSIIQRIKKFFKKS